jgi:hypothetical protein
MLESQSPSSTGSPLDEDAGVACCLHDRHEGDTGMQPVLSAKLGCEVDRNRERQRALDELVRDLGASSG